MKAWYLYSPLKESMPFQMALDRLLLEECRKERSAVMFPLLRFYESSEPWISVGYSYQRESGDDLPLCVRPTGGGKVCHGDDVIFSVIARKNADESFASVRASYVKIHEAVKAGFEALGEKPRFYSASEDLPKGKECFQFPIESDLAVGGRKIAGGSQKRSAGILLHQESVQCFGRNRAEVARRIADQFPVLFNMKFIPREWPPEILHAAREASNSR